MLEIEKLVYGGDGLARDQGRVVFVPYSLPGEVWEGGRVTTSSSDRIAAKCPYFERCGGCHYQHIPYERQLAEKRAILEETLARIGKIHPPPIDIVSAEPWAYRNRVQFHLDRGQIGYHAAGSKKLIPVTECPIASPGIEKALNALREMRRDSRFPRFLNSIELFTNEQETLVNVLSSDRPVSKRFFEWCAERIPGALLSSLDYATPLGSFHVSHKSFFQVNRYLVDRLAAVAVSGESGRRALDLYAGVGLFSRLLVTRFDEVTAVEVVRSAAADLAINVPEAAVAQETTEDFLAQAAGPYDFAIADPPRAGLGKRAVDLLLVARPARLTIVSCDPATLARDLAILTSSYNIEAMTLIDIFPQTFHIESVTRLVLR